MDYEDTTPFSAIYESFLAKITDDMYMELNELDTFRMLQDLLFSAIPKFEFPRVDITQYEAEYVAEETTYTGPESNYAEVTAYILGRGSV